MEKSQRFNDFLLKINVSRQDLSKKIDIPLETISRISKNKQPLRKQHALSIQAVYGVSAEWLLTGKGEMVPQEAVPPPSAMGLAPLANQPAIYNKSDQILRAVEHVGEDVKDLRHDMRDLRTGLRNTDTRLISVEERVSALEKLDFGLIENTGLSPKKKEKAKEEQST